MDSHLQDCKTQDESNQRNDKLKNHENGHRAPSLKFDKQRVASCRNVHPVEEIFLVTICAVISGCDSWEDI
jgi:hypothetical protein